MSLLNLSVKHGRTFDGARQGLEEAVRQAQAQFGSMIHRVDWAADRSAVTLAGVGFEARLRVDAQDVHAVVDVPLLGRVFGGSLASGLKGILQKAFPKQLT